MKITYLLTALLLNIHSYSEDVDVTQPIRINQLIPIDLTPITLAIEPSLPDNFVGLRDPEEMDDFELTCWGPEEVIRAYLKDSKSLEEPIIFVKLSECFRQPSFGTLDENAIKEGFANNKSIQASCTLGNWGDYPYCVISGTINKRPLHMVYVGSNELGGVVLSFLFITPKIPNGEALTLKLLDKFIKETKPLPEPLLFKAHGQELHPGYTIVDVATRKIKVIAEKRKSDSQVRFAVIPEDLNVCFKFESALIGIMEANWHNQEPLLKIKGSYIINNGWVTNFQTTSILIKEVDEFTPIPKLKKNVFFKEIPPGHVYPSIYKKDSSLGTPCIHRAE